MSGLGTFRRLWGTVRISQYQAFANAHVIQNIGNNLLFLCLHHFEYVLWQWVGILGFPITSSAVQKQSANYC